jgi:flagella basal body P-ring formation protein FlgA
MMMRWTEALRVIAGALVVAAGACGAEAAGVKLPVPVSVVYPGEVVLQERLVFKAFRKSYAVRVGALRRVEAVAGKVARRTLLPGKAILPGALREAYQVERGKQVRLVYRSDALMITGLAMALASGSTGDVIQVRNVDSGLTVAGVVQADGSVEVAGK